MFSLKVLNDTSRHIASITEVKSKKVVEIIFFTEEKRGEEIDNSDYKRDMTKYLKNGGTLKSEYRYNILPANKVNNLERETITVFGKSGSGKSYTIKNYVKNYLQCFKKNMVYYICIDDITNDESFKELIGEPRLVQIELSTVNTIIDVKLYEDCLFVFDDVLDVSTSIDLKNYYTEEEIANMNEIDKAKAEMTCSKHMKLIENNLSASLKNLLNAGRKHGISCISVFHRLRNGAKSSFVVTESSSCIVYPYGIDSESLKSFLMEKLSFSRNSADLIMGEKFYQYDFLSINTSGKPYFITPEKLQFF